MWKKTGSKTALLFCSDRTKHWFRKNRNGVSGSWKKTGLLMHYQKVQEMLFMGAEKKINSNIRLVTDLPLVVSFVEMCFTFVSLRHGFHR